jgi:hypothetical protein
MSNDKRGSAYQLTSTCPISRLTGQVKSQIGTCPVSALYVQVAGKKRFEADCTNLRS